MPGLITDPIAPITIPGGNGDLPASQFPTPTRIAVIDLVGPSAANRQHKSLEKRTVTLAQLVNALIANSNVIDDRYLRRDGSTQKDATTGIRGDMQMGGFKFLGLPAASANGHAVEYSQLVSTLAAIALKAPLASPALTGVPTAPTAAPGTNTTQLASTGFVTAAIAAIPAPAALDLVRPIPTEFISTAVSLGTGGVFYADAFSSGALQAFTKPMLLYSKGNVAFSGGILSSYPVTIECEGDVSFGGTVSCPFLTVRTKGNVTCAGPINAHSGTAFTGANSSHTSMLGAIKHSLLYFAGYDAYSQGFGDPILSLTRRSVVIEAGGNVSIAGTISANELLVKCGGTLTISGTHAIFKTHIFDPHGLTAWQEGDTQNGYGGNRFGGGGGTGGGYGYGNSATRSIWKGTPKPYLLQTYALAFGGDGGAIGLAAGDGRRSHGGGRCSLYADGAITLTGAVFTMTGGTGDEIGGSGADSGGGGGGTFRVVSKTSITGGTANLWGGSSNDNVGGGGGGGYAVAPAFGTNPILNAAGGPGAESGTALIDVVTAVKIDALKRQYLFDVIPIDTGGQRQ